ncbi:hypothetical protein [Sulfurimonas sp.]|uniref:hypothetical protein n=1 Tax=Sulfurimonas sp. TaxID=2022749 RepID=UPI00260161AB|nr:hypothetical protein [Sulfurimonas sp.]MDD3452570.1 hypothetical protein [Sulfurimonas sp.]
MQLVTLNNNEKDIIIGPWEIVQFVVNDGEVIMLQNLHRTHDVLFSYTNDLSREWFVLSELEFLRTDRTVFLSGDSPAAEIKLATDRGNL